MKKALINLVFGLLLLFSIICNAQGEANNWYFGDNAGISFNTSPPTVLLDGQLDTLEGCSSISTSNGDLLFYTDGRTIWSANHQVMPNANYFGNTGLNGDPSSTSSGLIVPHPTQDNLYYVFTVDEPHHDNAFAFPNQGPANPDGTPRSNYSDVATHMVPQDDDGFNNGFAYSLVDMNLNNGFGDVVNTEKNIELITYDPTNSEDVKFKCGEKITAVRGENCESVWVITHFKDTFYAFEIDDSGVNQTPVTSQLGPFVSTDDYRRAAIGYLKASPDGEKLLIANQTMDYDPITQVDQGTGNIFLLDFDAATGVVSNAQQLLDGVNAYGVEFSPSGAMAYASVTQSGVPQIYQWDLESGDILGSQFILPGVSGQGSGAIQVAPDGKIYRAILGQARLGVINNPEIPGEQADYTENFGEGAINLQGRSATFGLPPFIQSIFSSKIDITGLDTQQVNLCDGDTFTLFFGDDTVSADATYIWTKDGVELTAETESSLTISQPAGVSLPFDETYTLEANLNDGSCPLIGVANITYVDFPDTLSASLSECVTDFEQNSAEFDLTQANQQLISTGADLADFNFTYYETFDDAELSDNAIGNPNEYTNLENPQNLFVDVSTVLAGCSTIMELTLNIIDFNTENYNLSLCDDNQNGINIFDLNTIQEQENITVNDFYLTANEALNAINPISNPNVFQNSNPYEQDIFFTIDTNGACDDLGILTLNIIELPFVQDDIATYCIEQFPNPISISANIPENELNNFEFLWLLSEENTPEINVNAAGVYEVAITDVNTGCTNFRSVEVFESGLSEYTLSIEELLVNENTVTVNISPESLGDYEFSLSPNGPFQDNNRFDNLLPGFYDMYVRDKNGCGIVQKTFGIIGVMKYFTPNADGFNDVWRFKGVFNNKEAFANVYIFDRYGKLLKTFKGLNKFWDGTFNNKPMPSNDYWYKIVLENGRTLNGNFTLKR